MKSTIVHAELDWERGSFVGEVDVCWEIDREGAGAGALSAQGLGVWGFSRSGGTAASREGYAGDY